MTIQDHIHQRQNISAMKSNSSPVELDLTSVIIHCDSGVNIARQRPCIICVWLYLGFQNKRLEYLKLIRLYLK